LIQSESYISSDVVIASRAAIVFIIQVAMWNYKPASVPNLNLWL